jgi:hypothetical protein
MSPDPVELFGFTAASHSSDEPPITAVLATTERLDLLIIGGDVDLDPAGTPGHGVAPLRVDRPSRRAGIDRFRT